jgi:guanosine-3',5'-bis(diphosphate) 3'-pyrophosphohydrolase
MNDIYCWETKFKPCYYSDRLLNKISCLNEKVTTKQRIDLLEIKKAIYYAKKYHAGQMRDSGEPYYTHPLIVAEMVLDFCFDSNAIVAAILHDVIEDTNASIEDLSSIFGYRAAETVKKLTRFKLPDSNSKISSGQLIMQAYMLKEVVVVLIKLLDRLHNLQSIYVKNHEKQQKTYMEVLHTFYLLSFKVDYAIANKFQNYLYPNNVIQKQEYSIFSYGTYQLEFPAFQSNS